MAPSSRGLHWGWDHVGTEANLSRVGRYDIIAFKKVFTLSDYICK